jgi:dTDP-4-amino-4,6-dideoxygalactose transaminase
MQRVSAPSGASHTPVKTIEGPGDLAIHGAPPAFVEALHVGRPNIGNEDEFLRHTRGVLNRRWLTNNGPLVRELEESIAAQLGVRHCVAMCNGTVALEILIRALGLEGEVIVPAWTFIATAHALSWQGLEPVFADVDPATHGVDPASVEALIGPRTTGIIGVHLWGRPAPIDALQEIADRHSLALMFDAAHAFDCSAGLTKIGGFGRAEVFSFHATKVYNTMEGGAVTTNDDALAEAMRLTRNFGFRGYDRVISHGTNGKMPEMNAAMGIVNLAALPDFIAANRSCHEAYAIALRDVPGLRLLAMDVGGRNNGQYVVVELEAERASARDHLVAALHAENILARRYFWPGCHRMAPYDRHPVTLPETEALAERVIVLPTGPMLPRAAPEVVAAVLRFAG